jgi:hypothetical protein
MTTFIEHDTGVINGNAISEITKPDSGNVARLGISLISGRGLEIRLGGQGQSWGERYAQTAYQLILTALAANEPYVDVTTGSLIAARKSKR